MYVKLKNVVRSRNHFAVETQQMHSVLLLLLFLLLLLSYVPLSTI